MRISALPAEILEEIFSYLKLEDVLSCCLVCRSWRNYANSNKIWFSFCAELVPVTKSKFELLPNPELVVPAFKPTKRKNSTLTETCLWRQRFMQEIHISNNWRQGNCIPFAITKSLNPLCTEWDDEVLLVVSMERRQFSCYNINTRPKLVQTSPLCMRHVFADFFKLSGDMLVVAQCTLIQVYTKNKAKDCTFELSQRFLFNMSEKENSEIPIVDDLTEWYDYKIGLYPSDMSLDCDHNGQYFVGLLLDRNLNEAEFHIWDLNRRCKVGKQRFPDTDDPIVDMHFSLHSNNLHILLKVANDIEEHTIIKCFSLNTFKYTDLFIEFNYVVPAILFGSKHVLSVDTSNKVLSIWNSKDGSCEHTQTCKFHIHPATLQFVSSLIIFGGNNASKSNGVVKILNAETFETTSEFYVGHRLSNLIFVRAGLLIVAGLNELGLWDTKTTTKVQSFQYQDCLWISRTGTKSLVESEDDLILLKFW